MPAAMLRSSRGSPQDFHDLMRYRIMDVLLVASPYDTFILEEAGQLAERMLGEFRNLDLHYGPGLTGVSTGTEALALARQTGRFGLVISALTQREKLTEMVELPTEVHPWFVGVQFHPEFKSTPWDGHPLFIHYIKAALDHQSARSGAAEKVAA